MAEICAQKSTNKEKIKGPCLKDELSFTYSNDDKGSGDIMHPYELAASSSSSD